MESSENKQVQLITITNRKVLDIDGVKKLDSFDSKEFLIDTINGYVHVLGSDLSLGLMDMEKGKLTINGIVNSVSYLAKNRTESKESFFAKLFK